jgi:hypothetical protein
MPDDSTPPDEPYQESVDYSWTVKAFDMLECDDLHGEVVSYDEIIRSRVWGPCPRCGHTLDDHQTHTAVTNLIERRGRGGGATGEHAREVTGPAFFDVDVSCDCGNSHPGAPPGRTGCGVSFRVELPLRSVGRR